VEDNYFGDDERPSKPAIPMQEINVEPEATETGTEGFDEESWDGTVPEPPKPSLSDIWSNPCDYLNIIAFGLCGCFGLLSVLLVAAASLDMGKWLSVSLCILGFYAAYTIRMLAALKKELNELNEVQENLRKQVGRLTEEVKQFDAENERFKEETLELEKANVEFTAQIQELEQTSNELTAAKDEFEHHNDELSKEKDALSQSVAAMQGNLDRLTNQTNELENQYQQFQGLQSQIQKYAGKNGYDMGVALQKQTEMYEKMETVMRDNASTLLQQIAADMEFVDNEEGMSREEYNKWYNRIPQRFQKMLDAKQITFDTFKGDDEVVDYDEMSKLIETLLKDA